MKGIFIKVFLLVIFSIYSLLLFGNLCKPDQDDYAKETWEWNDNITCQERQDKTRQWKKNRSINSTEPRQIYEEDILIDNSLKYHIAQISWVLLVVLTSAFLIRELLECVSQKKKFFIKMDNYRRITIDFLLILCLLMGLPEQSLILQRWQYHVATITNFGLWFQMMIFAGKYPGYGKYIHMFKLVKVSIVEVKSCVMV